MQQGNFKNVAKDSGVHADTFDLIPNIYQNHLKRRNDGTKIKLNFLKLEKKDKLESLSTIINKDLEIFKHYKERYKIRDKEPQAVIVSFRDALMSLDMNEFNHHLADLKPAY